MFRKFFEKFAPKRLDDPLFGRLVFIKTRDPAKSYWEGTGTFPGTGTQIEFSVDGPSEGPGKEQHAFYHKLVEKYDDVKNKVSPLLAGHLAQWTRKSAPQDVWTVFVLASVSIPLRDSSDAEWDLGFNCSLDREYFFTVYMKGWAPSGPVSIDD